MWKCEKCGSFSEGNFCGFCGQQKPEGTPEATDVFVNKQTSADDETTAATADGLKGMFTEPSINNAENTVYQAPSSVYTDTMQNPYPQNTMPDANGTYNPYASQNNTYNPYGYDAYNYGGAPVPDAQGNDPRKKSSVKILWIVCAVLFAILIGLGSFAVYTFINDPSWAISDTDDDKDDNDNDNDNDDKGRRKEKVTKLSNDEIEDIINSQSSYTDFNIYVKNLTTGYEYGYNDYDEVLASAMSQIVILDTLSEMADNDEVDIDSEEIYFTYTPNGKYAPKSPGQNETYVTIRECIEDIAAYGDNNKSNQLIDFIAYKNGSENGLRVINNRLRDLGYDTTRVNRKTTAYANMPENPNVTCAYEIGNIFENLITNGGFGSRKYMTGIFRSVSINGEVIGLKAHIPSEYSSGCVNAFNSRTTNNVAYITDGKTELVVVLLANTDENKTDVENNDLRDSVQASLLDYILKNQFKK